MDGCQDGVSHLSNGIAVAMIKRIPPINVTLINIVHDANVFAPWVVEVNSVILAIGRINFHAAPSHKDISDSLKFWPR